MCQVIPIAAHPRYRCQANLQQTEGLTFYLDSYMGHKFYGYSNPGYYFWNKEYCEVYGPFQTMGDALEGLEAYLDSDEL